MNQPQPTTDGSETLSNLPDPETLAEIAGELEQVTSDQALLEAYPELGPLAEALEATGARWHYRHEIPDTAEKDPQLGPYAFRLYGHYQRVGNCFESVGTTHLQTGISVGKVTQAREALEEARYIRCERRSPGGPYQIQALDRPLPEGDQAVLEEAGIEPPSGGYTQVPNTADDHLSAGAYRIYVHLRRRIGGAGTTYVSRTRIAEATGMSRRTAGRALSELEANGYANLEEEGGGIEVRPIWLYNWLRYAAKDPGRLREALDRLSARWADMKGAGTCERARADMNQRSTPSKNTPSRSENAREEENTQSSPRPSAERLVAFIQEHPEHSSQFGPEAAQRAAEKFRARCQSTGWQLGGSPIIHWKPCFEAWLREWHRRAKQTSDQQRSRGGETTAWMSAAEVDRHAEQHDLTARGPAYEHNGKTGREARWRYVAGQAA